MVPAENLLYRRYRLIALAVNIGVLLAGVLDWLYSGLGRKSLVEAPEPLRVSIFLLSVATLIWLELRAVGQAHFFKAAKGHTAQVFLPFAVRLLLFACACVVSDLSYAKLLFLPLLLYSYFAVSRRVSYFLSFLSLAAFLSIGLSDFRGMGIKPPPLPLDVVLPSIVSEGMLPRNLPSRSGKLLDESMGLLITLAFTLLLARAMSQATQAQQKLTGLLSSLEASHAQLKGYAARVADLATTEERNRLARDIHDSLGHHLAAINIQLEKANAYWERDPKRAEEALNHAKRTVQDALRDVRVSVNSLRQGGEPFMFEKELRTLLQRMQHSDLTVSLHQIGDSSRYSRIKLMTLYRVIQEGLTNVHKHAGASRVSIALEFGEQQAYLELSDNGAGFDVAAWKENKSRQSAQGLIGLQERLSLVGSTLGISSRVDGVASDRYKGTTLTAGIPQTDYQVHLSEEIPR